MYISNFEGWRKKSIFWEKLIEGIFCPPSVNRKWSRQLVNANKLQCGCVGIFTMTWKIKFDTWKSYAYNSRLCVVFISVKRCMPHVYTPQQPSRVNSQVIRESQHMHFRAYAGSTNSMQDQHIAALWNLTLKPNNVK